MLLWYLWYGGIYETFYWYEPETVEYPEPSGSPGVTLASFEKVKVGMTYREVAATFGCDGTLFATTEVPGRELKHYRWDGAGGGFAFVQFVDGRVSNASQYGLRSVEGPEPSRAPEYPEPSGSAGVTLANFEKVKNGMTYREVAGIFGCEGNPRGSYGGGKAELKTYVWKDPRGGHASVHFMNGRVCRTYQYGLR